MKAFHTVAVPHADILAGRLTMDIFAADLWEVHKGRATDEYRDPTQFFEKTYQTEGLKHLLAVVENRLKGRGGDPVIQVQTPFGGGKTHALIAMYHNAPKWKAKRVVLVGTAMGPRETLWGALEQQLTGKTTTFAEPVSPGREQLRELLNKNQPLLILMDEVLEYVTKTSGVRVEESTLAAQSVAFLQELTEVAGSLEKICVVLTLPSSILEHYDERSEKLFQQLQKVAGRVEKIYTPVQEREVTGVIRQRLFSEIDQKGADGNVQEFMDYVVRESLLPTDIEPSEYRTRFRESFPFLPEVVDVLYKRWGSFSSFQRTRGVLRLLALVLQSLKDSGIPYVSLSDFDLSNDEIRRELLKHIGNEFDSVIAADITGEGAGAKRVNLELGKSYRGLGLGTRVAVSIFMYSFSGGPEKGVTLGETKRAATTVQNPSSVIAEAVDQLKDKLFYLQHQSGKYFFTNQPNINRTLLLKMENVEAPQLAELELELLKKTIAGSKLKVVLWPKKSADVADDQELKLVVLPQYDVGLLQEIFEKKGETPRVNRNTLLFLTPKEGERTSFQSFLRRHLGYQLLLADMTLNLSADQRKEVKAEMDRIGDAMHEALRRYYRQISVPRKAGFKEIDLGIPTYGERRKIDEESYEKLRAEGEMLERIVPLVVKERYLKNSDHVSTEQLFVSGMTTPGETRVVSRSVWEAGILEGVRQGVFGLGEGHDGVLVCHYFKQQASIAFSGNEVLIRAEICQQQMKAETEVGAGKPIPEVEAAAGPLGRAGEDLRGRESRKRLQLEFIVPKGKVSSLLGVLNFLQAKFSKLKIAVSAEEGEISEQEYDDKVEEAFRQMGVEPKE